MYREGAATRIEIKEYDEMTTLLEVFRKEVISKLNKALESFGGTKVSIHCVDIWNHFLFL